MSTRTLRLGPGPEGLAQARRALAGFERELDPGLFFDVSLCVNELVSNAIRALEPAEAMSVELELSRNDGALCAAVADHGAGARRLEQIIEGGHGGDFGLYIISRLAHRWGVDRIENRVWLEFALDDDEPPRASAFEVGVGQGA
jgi:anti-sigma regulatory factor (Ser/Thr protein kinase)